MINVLFAAHPDRWASYETPLKQAIANAGVEANLATDIPPADVDYIVYAPNSPLQDFTPYTRAKAVLNLWAGVEKIVGNETLKIPLTRMVDPGLSQGMCEWVTGHTLRHHLGMDAHINCAPGVWNNVPPPLAWDRKVTVLGLGELGTACAQMLALAGFDVTGWSRSPKNLDGIRCLSGEEGLTKALTGAEIVVLLLPDTPATENTLNAKTLALLAKGACIINPGRGPLIDDDALLAALDTGQVGHATLDVFRVEPLPEAHPFWHHPRVTVTPHVAAETRPKYSALTIAENIRRGEAGAPLLHLVDRSAGY
ncbi:glyoxylate/hydroxypyruvate reductase A [Sulfitobacter pseudonitzschiae]|uniref:Glyoxylate/hydroxypyruvate reductase A n=1 Tax=Pseudosulfitobacter pseudonitzschiae TaxID=1402135 RepID=A0A9Q2RW36_9RHOB|nr:glyoxylate/hydroxypyruvate reductase A [Pseudosulfitobacter pseudonitzschiae]MBM2293659.1 glyoxylate/hydroxypyruvate reductase A [Pseudosulfitobacter pseudonitzschiae]MBM2298473.1 glyoxylate/hydroxypyruvate reductase A [Pseudosulfitobacter pseudonitzschiae]MBM2303387.1 glyoxylate/hydroxypyruvate reductase A [Pseudosulfitobacter pseudonitzschiae]MBM2313170.1 glyoxylate/hydroxypyruvate reductase A [Pseudosulfitobacter pseudonitzschiae]MBM2318083.1 glyoxylate/hydroxypyruvate reductase A [Pseud